MESRPEAVVGDVGIPEDGARVAERGLLPLVETVRVLESKQLVVIRLVEPLPSSLDGPLDPSVLTLDRLGDVNPTQLLDLVVEHTLEERGPPGGGEGMEDGGNVGPDRLALWAGGAVESAVLDDGPILFGERREIGV
jgi:hypothetical protein